MVILKNHNELYELLAGNTSNSCIFTYLIYVFTSFQLYFQPTHDSTKQNSLVSKNNKYSCCCFLV